MNIHRPTLKTQARQAMAAARPRAFAMTLLYLLLTAGVSMLINLFFLDPLTRLAEFAQAGLTLPRALMLTLSETGGVGLFVHILVLIAVAVLDFGYHLWCLGTTRGGIGEWRDLFGGFSMVGRVLLLRLVVITYSFIWYMVSTMLAMVVSGAAMFVAPFGILSAIPIFAAAIGFFFWKVLHYSMADFCLMDEPDKGVFHAVTQSRLLMRGHCGQFLLLVLSFFGWWLLGFAIQLAAEGILLVTIGGPWLLTGDVYGAMTAVATLPLAGIVASLLYWPFSAWLTPYQTMTKCCLYNALRSGTQQ